ncbi:MAG: PspC domain-containing protein, partial [Nocardioides sp.]|uniref:PspC domain-containing protein n=1 Tax=Nocardioides sp. TaxID=35761 RepID=UPI0039E5F947
MSETTAGAAGAGAQPRAVRRATRDTEAAIFGGVAGGLAEHLAAPVIWVRAAFVVLTAMGGLGAVLYAALWAALPSRERFEAATPGAESAV